MHRTICAAGLALLAATTSPASAAPPRVSIGLHLGTAHFGEHGRQMNGVNPGVYVEFNGYTAGAYRNSYGRASAYAGYTLQWLGGLVAITGGLVTGYPGASVSPLLVPSLRAPVGSAFVRLSYLPKPHSQGASGLHLSVEQAF